MGKVHTFDDLESVCAYCKQNDESEKIQRCEFGDCEVFVHANSKCIPGYAKYDVDTIYSFWNHRAAMQTKGKELVVIGQNLFPGIARRLHDSTESGSTHVYSNSTIPDEAAPRKRGRPPKNASNRGTAAAPRGRSAPTTSLAAARRKPSQSPSSSSTSPEDQPAKRARGRPRNAAAPTMPKGPAEAPSGSLTFRDFNGEKAVKYARTYSRSGSKRDDLKQFDFESVETAIFMLQSKNSAATGLDDTVAINAIGMAFLLDEKWHYHTRKNCDVFKPELVKKATALIGTSGSETYVQ